MLLSSSETYPLTTIDLANLCPKASGQRYRELREWQPPRNWIAYTPTRNNWSKLLAQQPSLDLILAGDGKEALLAAIARECRYGEKDVAANLAASAAIWDWARENDVRSIAHEFSPHRCSLATNRFLEDGIILLKDRGLAGFLDTRRSSSCLSPAGRDFVFSVNYWKLAGIAEYVDIELVIIGLTDSKSRRKVKMFEFDGKPVFSKSEVEERIEETQRIWLDVQLERRDRSSKGIG